MNETRIERLVIGLEFATSDFLLFHTSYIGKNTLAGLDWMFIWFCKMEIFTWTLIILLLTFSNCLIFLKRFEQVSHVLPARKM